LPELPAFTAPYDVFCLVNYNARDFGYGFVATDKSLCRNVAAVPAGFSSAKPVL
jgi:hypothetical protein